MGFLKKSVLVSLGVLFLAASGGAWAQEPVTLKISTTVKRPNEAYVLLDYVAARVKQLTKGQVAIEVLQPFASERDMYEQVLLGQLQGQASSVDAFGQFVPAARIASLPMFYESFDDVWKVLDGPIGQQIRTQAEAKGFKVLGFMGQGIRGLIMRNPVKSIDDVKGHKVRIQNSPIWSGFYRALGVIAVPMDWNDIYTGLQSGVIDGVDTVFSSSLNNKHQEVAPHGVTTRHSYQVQIFVVSNNVWKKLTPDQQKAIEQAVAEGLPAERFASISQQGYEAILNWRIANGEVADPSPEFLEAMRKAAEAARPDFAKAVGGEDVLKQAEASLGRN
jgi:TRAP-type C4-dicarboxylate transport system substrate-binding protein